MAYEPLLADGHLVVEQEVLGQVEDQQAAHAVEGESLPHLGEEQDEQPPRVLAQQLQNDRYARDHGDQNAGQDDDAVHEIPRVGRWADMTTPSLRKASPFPLASGAPT